MVMTAGSSDATEAQSDEFVAWVRRVEEQTGRPFWKTQSLEAAFQAGIEAGRALAAVECVDIVQSAETKKARKPEQQTKSGKLPLFSQGQRVQHQDGRIGTITRGTEASRRSTVSVRFPNTQRSSVILRKQLTPVD
jgi:hypothetical protein